MNPRDFTITGLLFALGIAVAIIAGLLWTSDFETVGWSMLGFVGMAVIAGNIIGFAIGWWMRGVTGDSRRPRVQSGP